MNVVVRGGKNILDRTGGMAPKPEDIPEDIHVLNVTSTRLRGCLFDLPQLKMLEHLCIRNNFLHDVSALERNDTFVGSMVHLDMYGNNISEIHAVGHLVNLTFLDLSFNQIRKIEGIEALVHLKELYLANNKITKIEGLSTFVDLELLEIGSNRIRTIENLEALTNLKELWLGRNKITKIQGIETLTKLEKFSLQNNRVTVIEGLDNNTALQELYISHNGLTEISEGLVNLVNLHTLDLATNFITGLDNLHTLENIKEFWFNNNKIEDMEEVDKIAHMTKVETIYLRNNPVANHPRYRPIIIKKFPSLIQLDADYVTEADIPA